MKDNSEAKEIVARINSSLGEDSPGEEMINRILVARNEVNNGAPLGTRKRHKDTGEMATRMNLNGIHTWKVIDVNSGAEYYIDMPQLGADWIDD